MFVLYLSLLYFFLPVEMVETENTALVAIKVVVVEVVAAAKKLFKSPPPLQPIGQFFQQQHFFGSAGDGQIFVFS